MTNYFCVFPRHCAQNERGRFGSTSQCESVTPLLPPSTSIAAIDPGSVRSSAEWSHSPDAKRGRRRATHSRCVPEHSAANDGGMATGWSAHATEPFVFAPRSSAHASTRRHGDQSPLPPPPPPPFLPSPTARPPAARHTTFCRQPPATARPFSVLFQFRSTRTTKHPAPRARPRLSILPVILNK